MAAFNLTGFRACAGRDNRSLNARQRINPIVFTFCARLSPANQIKEKKPYRPMRNAANITA